MANMERSHQSSATDVIAPVRFTYETTYPMRPLSSGSTFNFDCGDVRYMQDHIRTFRAANSGKINGTQGKYFDGALTLLDAFIEYTESWIFESVESCTINIAPETLTAITFHVLAFPYSGACERKEIRLEVQLEYTMVGCKDTTNGVYTIRLTNTETKKSCTIGTSRLADAMTDPGVDDNATCFIADKYALRYCECFPTPSVMKDLFDQAQAEVLTDEEDYNA